ncbi:hypothetical protein [Pseudomonas sp. S9]|nr:hypothetical protein [Pseudomonas sp. S9]
MAAAAVAADADLDTVAYTDGAQEMGAAPEPEPEQSGPAKHKDGDA